jgi:hypothetical protein
VKGRTKPFRVNATELKGRRRSRSAPCRWRGRMPAPGRRCINIRPATAGGSSAGVATVGMRPQSSLDNRALTRLTSLPPTWLAPPSKPSRRNILPGGEAAREDEPKIGRETITCRYCSVNMNRRYARLRVRRWSSGASSRTGSSASMGSCRRGCEISQKAELSSAGSDAGSRLWCKMPFRSYLGSRAAGDRSVSGGA